MYFGEESRCFFLFLPTLYFFKQFFCTSWSIRNIFIWQFRRCYDIFYWKLWKNRLKIHFKSKNICFILWQFSGYPIDHRMKLTFKVSNFSFTIFCPSFIVLFCKMWIEASLTWKCQVYSTPDPFTIFQFQHRYLQVFYVGTCFAPTFFVLHVFF